MRPSKPEVFAFLLVAACLTFDAKPARGGEFVAGWEGTSSRGYSFLSPAFEFPLAENRSWLIRGAASYLYYDLPELGGTTEVRSPGQSLGVALRFRSERATWTLGSGYEVRQTRRRLADGSELRENENGLTLQGDVFYQATPAVNLSAIAAYGAANDYFWTRVGAKRQLTNLDYSGATTLHAGVEVTVQGNEDTDATQFGSVFEIGFPRAQASLQFRAGRQRTENPGSETDSETYFGVGVYRGF